MSSLKKNIGLQMSYRVLTIITPLITSPIISRALGAEKIGVYSATQAYANYFMLFAMLGIEYYGQRSIASTQTRNERSVMFWEIYAVQCGASIASIVIYYLSAYFWSSTRVTILMIQGLWVISCLFDINWLFLLYYSFYSQTIGFMPLCTDNGGEHSNKSTTTMDENSKICGLPEGATCANKKTLFAYYSTVCSDDSVKHISFYG